MRIEDFFKISKKKNGIFLESMFDFDLNKKKKRKRRSK